MLRPKDIMFCMLLLFLGWIAGLETCSLVIKQGWINQDSER